MKKILAAWLAVAMLMSVGAAALAEEENITLTMPDVQQLNPAMKENAPKLATSGDIVTADGNHVTIIAEGLQLDLNLDPTMGLVCFTQSILASFDAYWGCSDPGALCNILIEEGIHALLLSDYTGNEFHLYLPGGDGASAKIGDLHTCSESLRVLYAGKLAGALAGTDNYAVISTGASTWCWLPEYDIAATVAGGQYVLCSIGTNGRGMTQDDMDEMMDVLSCVSVSAAR